MKRQEKGRERGKGEKEGRKCEKGREVRLILRQAYSLAYIL